MSTNQDRAAEVLGRERYSRSLQSAPGVLDRFIEHSRPDAQALAGAGLLAPDTAAQELEEKTILIDQLRHILRGDEETMAEQVKEIAELRRVRRELEERIRVWQKVTDKLEASGDTDVAEVMRHVGRSVARILNGETNE